MMAVGQAGTQAAGNVMAAHQRNKAVVKAAEFNNRATTFNMESNQIARTESRVAYAHKIDAIQRATRKAKGSAIVSGLEAGVVPNDVVDALMFDISDTMRAERISQENAEFSFDRQSTSIQFQAEQQRSQLYTQDLFSALIGGVLGIGGGFTTGQLQNKQYKALDDPSK